MSNEKDGTRSQKSAISRDNPFGVPLKRSEENAPKSEFQTTKPHANIKINGVRKEKIKINETEEGLEISIDN